MASPRTFIIMFDVTVIGLLVLYGTMLDPHFATIINNDINTLFGPWPTFSPPKTGTTTTGFPACLLFLPTCFSSTTSSDTFGGLLQLMYAFAYIASLMYSFALRINAAGSLFINLFSLSQDFGIPFVNFFLLGLNLLLALDFVGIFRGVGSGVD